MRRAGAPSGRRRRAKADCAVPMFRAAQVAAFGRRAGGEHRDARKLATRRPKAVAGPWRGGHRAEPFVPSDDGLRLGKRDLDDRAAFESRHRGARIAWSLPHPDAPLVGDGARQRSLASPCGLAMRPSRNGGSSGAHRHVRRRRGRRTRPEFWHGLAWSSGLAWNASEQRFCP